MSEEIYYIHIDGVQKGPFRKESLAAEGLTSYTMIWRPGLETWVEASTLPELSDLFIIYSQPQETVSPPPIPGQGYYRQQNSYNPYGNPYGPQPNPYGAYGQNPMVPGTYPRGWTNWLGWAIAATILGLFCYLILCIPGIIGIVKANEANALARQGDPRAYFVNSTAKAWTLVGLIFSGICILGVILLVFIFGAFIYGLADVKATGY